MHAIPQELLDGPRDDLIQPFRIDDADVRVWRPVSVEARCRCSRERMDRVLRSFPRLEIVEMVVDGAVTAMCEFCNAGYAFPPVELGLN
jgi:molecular chaperone Hsp33